MKKVQTLDLLVGTRKTEATYMIAEDFDIKAFRKALKLNQHEFWPRLGITQSGGSRYETGQSIPEPVRILMPVVYPVPDKYLIPIN